MKNRISKTAQLTQVSIMFALMAVLTFTPLGFIVIPPISITILHIPVIIGAILMGPKYGGILGFFFGFLSMTRATFLGVLPMDMLLSPFASPNPLGTVIMCFLPRIFLGLIAGILYMALKDKLQNKTMAIGISAGVATICHTLSFLSFLWMFFKTIPFKQIFMTVISVNGSLELIVGIVASVAVCSVLLKFVNKGSLTNA